MLANQRPSEVDIDKNSQTEQHCELKSVLLEHISFSPAALIGGEPFVYAPADPAL